MPSRRPGRSDNEPLYPAVSSATYNSGRLAVGDSPGAVADDSGLLIKECASVTAQERVHWCGDSVLDLTELVYASYTVDVASNHAESRRR